MTPHLTDAAAEAIEQLVECDAANGSEETASDEYCAKCGEPVDVRHGHDWRGGFSWCDQCAQDYGEQIREAIPALLADRRAILAELAAVTAERDAANTRATRLILAGENYIAARGTQAAGDAFRDLDGTIHWVSKTYKPEDARGWAACWEKERARADAAESALAAASPPGQPAPQPATAEFDAEKWAEQVRFRIDNSPSVNRVEIIASEGGLLWLSAYATGGLAAREQPKRWPDEKPDKYGMYLILVTPDTPQWTHGSYTQSGWWPWAPKQWLPMPQPLPPAPKEVRP